MASNSEWHLTDQVINDYFKLIEKENPTIYAFDTFFYERLLKSGYESVQRWTKNVDLFSKKKIYFPVNVKEETFAYWLLVVADIEKQKVIYYDSHEDMYKNEIPINIFEYLKREHRKKWGLPLPVENWKIEKGLNPTQTNNYDGGVYVCLMALYLSRGCKFNFRPEHMLSFRKLIALELMMKQLLP